MADEQTIEVSGHDIQAVAGKLEALSKDMPPNQRVVLDWLLERAANAPGEPGDTEVQGYLFSPTGIGPGSTALRGSQFTSVGREASFPTYFNQALGFAGGRASAVTGTVSVGVRF